MKQTRSLSEFSWPSEFTRLYPNKSTLECILTDETASDVTRIFESDRERATYLNQKD